MRLQARRGISEIYASMLMVGVTLSFGSVVVSAAINQFNASTNSGSLVAAAQQASAGKLVSLVYDTVVQGSGGCSVAYGGYTEGTVFTVALYNYGTVSFTPAEVFDNATLLSSGSWSGAPSNSVTPGSMTTFTLTLMSCAHPAGQTFVLVDASGDEVTIGT